MNESTQIQKSDCFVQISFRIDSSNKEDNSIYLPEFSKLIQGVVEVHNCLAIHAYGEDSNLHLELLRIQMNSPLEFDLGVFEDIADALIKLLKIPYEILKCKKELEGKEIEIEKKHEEVNMLQSQSQHQQNIQSMEIQGLQIDLDRKRMELAAYGHEKIKEVLESLSSLKSNPQAAQVLAFHTEQCIKGISKISESHSKLLIIDIKPIYKDTDGPLRQQLISGNNKETDEKN